MRSVLNKRKKKKYRPKHGDVKRTYDYYEMIDGNFTNHPVAYCKRYKGALTRGMMNTHGCTERKCNKLDMDYKFE